MDVRFTKNARLFGIAKTGKVSLIKYENAIDWYILTNNVNIWYLQLCEPFYNLVLPQVQH